MSAGNKTVISQQEAAQEREQVTASLSYAPLPVMQGPGRIFRYAFWNTAAKITLAVTVMGPLTMYPLIASSFSDRRIQSILFITVLIMSLVYGLLLTALVTLCYPVRIGRDGISGHSQWGTRHNIVWREVVGARPVNILTFRYLRIWGDGSLWALWMPLYLKDMDTVRTTVLEFAPPESPLRAFFEAYRA